MLCDVMRVGRTEYTGACGVWPLSKKVERTSGLQDRNGEGVWRWVSSGLSSVTDGEVEADGSTFSAI